MFKTRLLSGIILVILTILSVVLGGDVLLTVVGCVSLIGMFELYRVLGVEKSLLGLVGYLAAIIYFLEQILENIDIIGSAQSVVGSKHN